METIVKIHVKLEVNVKKNVETIVKIHVQVKLKINAKKNVERIVKSHVQLAVNVKINAKKNVETSGDNCMSNSRQRI